MLGSKDVVAIVSVKDLARARRFYEDVLELKVVEQQDPDHLLLQSGSAKLILYRSDYAGTNQATTASWFVGSDVDAVVSGLKAKGVSFEHYDMPGVTREGDIHVVANIRAAWFKDPDGNILNVANE